MKKCTKCGIEKSIDEFEKLKIRPTGRGSRCKLCANKQARDYYYRNHEHLKKLKVAATRRRLIKFGKTIEWRKAHNDAHNRWRKRHPVEANFHSQEHAIKKLKAQPAWANEFFIKEIYKLARMRTKIMGFKWHVDHIVPLRHSLVCGLHWERNLQVIPACSNIRKGNRYWPDMP